MKTSSRHLALACLALPLAACKLSVVATSGGDVESASNTRDCAAGNVCEFNIISDDFSDAFTATPNPGYTFSQWADGPNFQCGGSTNPTCNVSNLGLGAIGGVMALITGDSIYYAMPLYDFVGTDTDGDGTQDHLDDDDDNDGVLDVDDLYPFDDSLTCPASYALRSPTAVLTDLRDAIGREDWDDVACQYRPDAYILADQGILVGHSDIVTAAQSLNALFNGVNRQVIQESVFRNTARELYSLDAGWVEIADGVNSYIIEDGVITGQTEHGLITFNGPPP